MGVTVAEHLVRPAHDGEAGDRGSLTVHDRAVARVAEFAAAGVEGVVRQSSGFGRVMGRGLPRVESNVSGGHVRVRVAIASAWPRSVAAVSAAVRAGVTEQVEAGTGLAVDRVDVVADDVVTGVATAARRVLQ